MSSLRAFAVRCPGCGAAPGEACADQRMGPGRPTSRRTTQAHHARAVAARDAGIAHGAPPIAARRELDGTLRFDLMGERGATWAEAWLLLRNQAVHPEVLLDAALREAGL